MDKGEIVEFDSPFNLLANNNQDEKITNTNTIFSQMVKNTGSKNS